MNKKENSGKSLKITILVILLILAIIIFAIYLSDDKSLSFIKTCAKILLPVGVAVCITVSIDESKKQKLKEKKFQLNHTSDVNNKTSSALKEPVGKEEKHEEREKRLEEREKRLKEAFEANLKEIKEKGIEPVYQIAATEVYLNVVNGLKQDGGQLAGDHVLWCISILTGIACQHSAMYSPICSDEPVFFTETKSKELFMFSDSLTYYLFNAWNMAAGTYHKLFPDRPIILFEKIQSNVAQNIGKDGYKVWDNSTNSETVKEFFRAWEKQYDNILLKKKIPAKNFAMVYSVALCIALETVASVFPKDKDPFSMAIETTVYCSHCHEPFEYSHDKTEKLKELGLL